MQLLHNLIIRQTYKKPFACLDVIYKNKVMKTSIYNKDEHTEGYFGKGNTDKKSDVQKAHEKGNEGNDVTPFGRVPIAEENANDFSEGNIKARDGFDNTGTQGKDSLSDDSFNSHDKHHTVESAASGTGSSSDDFDDDEKSKIKQRNEDDVLNTGI
ncbi:hypothetical protein G6M26_00275 [Agrobacterium tumefaciens]|nr:hypothetical protein [Agrobacterium tumefaciens]NTE16953.1 hypothetical protein [Agrobacterium tumefaciens]